MSCSNRFGSNHHSFDHPVRIRFEQHAVHERAGITFVAIANQVFYIRLLILHHLPFQPGTETTASPSPEAAVEYFLYNLLRIQSFKADVLRFKTAIRFVFLHVQRVDNPAVFGGNRYLAVEKIGNFLFPEVNGKTLHSLPNLVGLYFFEEIVHSVFHFIK